MGYEHDRAEAAVSSAYLWRPVERVLRRVNARRVFEVGCGNGALAAHLDRLGIRVTAVDSSTSGIDIARTHNAGPIYAVASAYDDLAAQYGQFEAVVSLEVVEHCFEPRAFAKTIFNLTAPHGTAVISTPFHGYWKNLAIALSGSFDRHFDPLWDYGHIKFWSEKTLRTLLEEAGFSSINFIRVGRVKPLAKSMIAIAKRHAR